MAADDKADSLGCSSRPASASEIAESPRESNVSDDIHERCEESQGRDEECNIPDLNRTVSTVSRPVSVVKVPRSQRRGLLGRFSIVYEAEEPKNYPRNTKWLITFWISLAAVTAPLGSSIILPALPEITKEFNTTAIIANLTIALYMLSMSLFPLWWSSFSETLGRRTIYLSSFAMYTIFNVVAAESRSIGMLIVFRLLSGGSSASVQAVGAGTVADIWEVKERGAAMGIFYLGPLAGPLIAPVVGGALTLGLGWRSTQWFQVIYGVFMLVGILLFLPETLKSRRPVVELSEHEAMSKEGVLPQIEPSGDTSAPVRPPLSRVSSRRSVRSAAVTTRKWLSVLRRFFIDPLKIAKYLKYPAVALTVYYASICFGALYFLNISVEKTFSGPPYNFSSIEVGCLYMSNSLGYFVTSIIGGRWVDRIMHREARKANRYTDKGKLIFRPEDRMQENAWLAAFIMPASLLWYGWSADRGVYWVCPIIANFFFGAGSMLIFAAATTMLTEFMPKRASNGVALNNFVRNVFAFAGSFLAEPLINAIGNGWLFTAIAIVAGSSCFVIVAMHRYGEKWRKTMDRELG